MKKFLLESKHFLKIGIPILGSQMSYMIMYTTDTIVSGRYGADELAGLVIANAFTFTIYMLFLCTITIYNYYVCTSTTTVI